MAGDRLARLAKKTAHRVAEDIEHQAALMKEAGADENEVHLAFSIALMVRRKADANAYYRREP